MLEQTNAVNSKMAALYPEDSPSNFLQSCNKITDIKIDYIYPECSTKEKTNVHPEVAYINSTESRLKVGTFKNIEADFGEELLDSPQQYHDYKPLSDKCHENLRKICETYKVSLPIVIVLPNNGLAVIGDNIKTIELEIIEALADAKLSRIEVRDINSKKDGIVYTDLLSGEVQRFLWEKGIWTANGKAICELVVTANEKKSSHKSKYAVVAGHFILTRELSKTEEAARGNRSHIHSVVEERVKECQYVFKTENSDDSDILSNQPLLAYRYWGEGDAPHTTQSDQSEESVSVMNDIALLKFDSYENDRLANKTKLFVIPSKRHLDLLASRQQSIVVGDLEGRLIHSPQSVVGMGKEYGLHLAFTITSKDASGRTMELTEGDSGRVVYFKGKQGQLILVGMLVGRFSEDFKAFDSGIYQAILLCQALKEVEQEYPQQISDIQLHEIYHKIADRHAVEKTFDTEAYLMMAKRLRRMGEGVNSQACVDSQTDGASDKANEAVQRRSTTLRFLAGFGFGMSVVGTLLKVIAPVQVVTAPAKEAVVQAVAAGSAVGPVAAAQVATAVSAPVAIPVVAAVGAVAVAGAAAAAVIGTAAIKNNDEVDLEIIEVLCSNDICRYQILHVPGETNKIEVAGEGVVRVEPELSAIGIKWKYEITMQERVLRSHPEVLKPLTLDWINLCAGGARTSGELSLKVDNSCTTSIELIMQEKSLTTAEIFALTTAHSLLDDYKRGHSISQSISLEQTERESKLDIVGSPKNMFKFWSKDDPGNKTISLLNIALLPVDQTQISLLDVIPYLPEKKPAAKAYIANLRSIEELKTLEGKRICCTGKRGKIIRRPLIEDQGWRLGEHLAFVLDENDRLQDGDCGSLIYAIKCTKRMEILGMYFGQLKSDNRVHLATILSRNIQSASEQLGIDDLQLA